MTPSLPASSARPPTSVLLVDDEPDFVDVLAERLRARGLDTDVAYDAFEAHARLAVRPFDVVLLDVNMPGQSGLEAIESLKEAAPFAQIILLTGSDDLRTAVTGMRRGACNYLVKPVGIDDLLAEIRRALQRKVDHEEAARMLLVQRLAAYGMFAQGVAHEINNPLNMIIQEAEWCAGLVDDLTPGDPAAGPLAGLRRGLENIRGQAGRCGAITRGLLRFGGGAAARPADAAPAALVEKAAARAKRRARDMGAELVVESDADLPTVHVPLREMEQVLDHLTANALDALLAPEPAGTGGAGEADIRPDATPERARPGARVRIRARAEGEGVRFEVEDNGHGVDPALLHRVFEPFFSTKRVGSGAGLGLSICYGVVSTLGGSIALANVPGGGCRATVTLPARPPRRRAAS
ncbi:MAG: response regulator [Desulfovibrionaceae bacterium]|jgi:signal transduction histidine kinase|nr:response regulator [Desulfovibrionaceae bacterium]